MCVHACQGHLLPVVVGTAGSGTEKEEEKEHARLKPQEITIATRVLPKRQLFFKICFLNI